MTQASTNAPMPSTKWPSHLRLALLMIISLAILVMSVAIGHSRLPLDRVIPAMLGLNEDFIVQTLRLPRSLLACSVGALLGLSGFLLQRLLRNPLASPDIVGITSGASVGAVLFIVVAAGAAPFWQPIWAFIGALTAAAALLGLTWKQRLSVTRVVLVGICLNSGFAAITTLLLVMSESTTSAMAYTWLTGTLYGANSAVNHWLIPATVVALLGCLLLKRELAVLALSDEQQVGLGLSTLPIRLLILCLSAAMAALAVSFAGAIGFVGLLAPHLTRQLLPKHLPGQLIGCALIGANLLLLADLAGRTLFLPRDLPAGIFVSAIGGPFFIFLLARQRR
ncbi:FecCD family ABC transporter permease [Reinekea blandensis]|uniref:ABC-type enterobactin transport system, permease component n=1 Tax=Reinekea blandensis MED297 TaxID=314283 RepID=A4BJ28_9GAMM|nr:iron ABC transporter permease [Reinekea blandensis]EAR07873.1 ABC-type enterobactin transport system, permease component [Reinekea sp. MED297] [Reinekea blandensis MED297]